MRLPVAFPPAAGAFSSHAAGQLRHYTRELDARAASATNSIKEDSVIASSDVPSSDIGSSISEASATQPIEAAAFRPRRNRVRSRRYDS